MLPANALRLSALVAAAMASGYLWRGAVEVNEPTKVVQSSAPAIGFALPDAPFGSLGHLQVRVARASRPAVKRGVVVRATSPRSSLAAHSSGTARAIAAVEAPQPSPVVTRRAKHRSRVAGAQPAPPVAPPPPPASAPEPTPPPPARVETGPGQGKKGEKKAKKQKPVKQPKVEKQKGEKGDKEQRKGKEKK